MVSKADSRRAALLTKLGVSGIGKSNTDLERQDLIATAGLNETTAAKLSMADLGYRENNAILPEVISELSGSAGTLISRWVGAPTANGFTVVTKTSTATQTRLKISTASDLTVSPKYSSIGTPDASGVTKFSVSGLIPDTLYYYGVEAGPGGPTAARGTVKTLPSVGANSSFTFAVVGCQNVTDSAAWIPLKARNPLFNIWVGDLFYADGTALTLANFRSRYDTVLGLSNTKDALANIPTMYTWSDHDFGLNNNSTGSSIGASATDIIQSVYTERVPHYPLVSDSDGTIAQTWVVGQVRFIMTDNRSHKSAVGDTDNSSKTVLGAAQKAWFKDLITSSSEKVIFWVNEQPWTDTPSGQTPVDEWPNYNTERQELADYIANSGKYVYVLSGDQHSLAYDSGVNSPGGMAVAHTSPLFGLSSIKGKFSGGTYPATEGVASTQLYGIFTVTQEGTNITVDFKGYDSENTQRISATKTYDTSIPNPPPPSAPDLVVTPFAHFPYNNQAAENPVTYTITGDSPSIDVGEHIVIMHGWSASTAFATESVSVTDSKGNAWVVHEHVMKAESPGCAVTVISSKISTPLVAGDTVTITQSAGTSYRDSRMYKVEGLVASGHYDKSSEVVTNTASTGASVTHTPTSSRSVSFAMSFTGTTNSAATINTPAEWTDGYGLNVYTTSRMVRDAYRINLDNDPVVYNPTWSLDQVHAVLMATFNGITV